MKLTLPPRLSGQPLEVDTSETRQLIIIGANGSGKTRFANRMMADLGSGVFKMSALKALYGKDVEDLAPGSIDSLYREATSAGSNFIRNDIKGEFDRMLALMLNEEMLKLLDFKYHVYTDDDAVRRRDAAGTHGAKLPATRLDRMVRLWQRVFPGNKVLIESGRMIFGSERSDDTYSSAKLSAGERAVLYYIGAAMFAPQGATVFVESPDMFLHPSSIRSLWDRIEEMRRDCSFVYITHDLSFASTRGDGLTVWVKGCDLSLDIEGDGVNSIDAKLYPLIFEEYTVKSLGGCDRVIESTRTFNSLRAFHNLDAFGIVDRDRRNEAEVSYLRGKKILVPEVAEIENIFMLEKVVRAVARHFRRDEDEAFAKVKKSIMRLFETDLRQQALMHTRHQVKKTVEHRIDGRFANIGKLEEHINDLCQSINPRGIYEEYCRDFRRYVAQGDYAAVLKVYNRKTMISESHVARACGLRRDDKDTYIRAILSILKENRDPASTVREAIRDIFGLERRG